METRGGKVANYDVRIAVYHTAKGDAVCVRFRDSLEELISSDKSDRIKVMRDGNRLYFVVKSCSVSKRGDGTSCIANSMLQYSRKEQVDLCKPFIGEYSLDFDAKHKSYYVDLGGRKTFENIGNSRYNIPQKGNKRAVVKRVPKQVSFVNPIKEEKSGDAFFNNMDNREQQKAEIIRLLDILDVDETQSYARAIVRLVKEKVNATY